MSQLTYKVSFLPNPPRMSVNGRSNLNLQRPQPATERDMTKFHADDYVQFLKMITPQNMHDNIKQLQRFNVGEDCPVFDGMYAFCQERSTA